MARRRGKYKNRPYKGSKTQRRNKTMVQRNPNPETLVVKGITVLKGKPQESYEITLRSPSATEKISILGYQLNNIYEKFEEHLEIEWSKEKKNVIDVSLNVDEIAYKRARQSVLKCAFNATNEYLKKNFNVSLTQEDEIWFENHPETVSIGLPENCFLEVLQALVWRHGFTINNVVFKRCYVYGGNLSGFANVLGMSVLSQADPFYSEVDAYQQLKEEPIYRIKIEPLVNPDLLKVPIVKSNIPQENFDYNTATKPTVESFDNWWDLGHGWQGFNLGSRGPRMALGHASYHENGIVGDYVMYITFDRAENLPNSDKLPRAEYDFDGSYQLVPDLSESKIGDKTIHQIMFPYYRSFVSPTWKKTEPDANGWYRNGFGQWCQKTEDDFEMLDLGKELKQIDRVMSSSSVKKSKHLDASSFWDSFTKNQKDRLFSDDVSEDLINDYYFSEVELEVEACLLPEELLELHSMCQNLAESMSIHELAAFYVGQGCKVFDLLEAVNWDDIAIMQFAVSELNRYTYERVTAGDVIAYKEFLDVECNSDLRLKSVLFGLSLIYMELSYYETNDVIDFTEMFASH